MLFVGSREIDIAEYDLKSIKTTRARKRIINNHLPLFFNDWRLSHAIARTICSKHLGNKDYWFDFISTLFGLSNLVDSNHPNIRIKTKKINYLRDFSRTSRIGEISQGVVWLYLQENNFPFINDFHFYCSQNDIIVSSTDSTPDFVGQDANVSNRLCLAESKGKEEKSTGLVKAKLYDALAQCDNGELLLLSGGIRTQKKLGFCTEWAENTSTNNSILHFVDPEINFGERSLDKNPMKFHYAAWFYMIGDFENSDRLIEGKPIILDKSNFEIITLNDKLFWIFSNINIIDETTWSSSENRYFKRMISRIFFRENKYGISKTVIDMLQNNEQGEISRFENLSSYNYELFTDGTIILKT